MAHTNEAFTSTSEKAALKSDCTVDTSLTVCAPPVYKTVTQKESQLLGSETEVSHP